MNWAEIVPWAAGLGIGGAVGAALAVLAAGAGLASAWDVFAVQFRSYVHGRTDPETTALQQSFDGVRLSLGRLLEAVRRLRKMLRLP